jgi:hypothetical protein
MDMRQLWRRASRPRLALVAATVSVITLAASSPIYSAVRGSHAAGHSTASPVAAGGGASTASSDCSEATARQVVQRLGLEVNIFDLPDPVQRVLCGPFTGPGSNAMAVTIAAPTCWPTQNWAVFRFTAGDWQLVLNQPAYLSSPLVAVGADIRETTAVHRSGDSRCFSSGGTHARIWHWDGTRLVAGPWKQVTKGEPERRGFYSPSRSIGCGMYDDSSFRSVDCQSYSPSLSQKVKMDAGGRLTICRDRGTQNRCNIGNAGEGTPTLGYGKQITVGRFRCQSLRSGMRCTVVRSGKGFLISRSGVRRVGP